MVRPIFSFARKSPFRFLSRKSTIQETNPKNPFDKDGKRDRAELKKYVNFYRKGGLLTQAINAYALSILSNGYRIECDDEIVKSNVEAFLHRIYFEESAEQAIKDALITGDGFQEISYGKGGESRTILELLPRDASTFEVLHNEYGDIQGYRQFTTESYGLREKYVDLAPYEIVHTNFNVIGGSPYGLGLIQTAYDDIIRDCKIAESIEQAIIRHGFPKYKITVGTEGERIPTDVMNSIESQFRDINAKNEWILSSDMDMQMIDTMPLGNIQGYGEWSIDRLTASLAVPSEILGLGRGSTEACYSDDTEVLTEHGWKRWYEMDVENDRIAVYDPATHQTRYEKPESFHIYDHYGPMYHFKNDNHDIMVTPNHSMCVISHSDRFTKDEPPFRIIEAQDITAPRFNFVSSTRAFEDDCAHCPFTDDELSFIGYFLSEGCCSPNIPGNRITVSQKKPESAIKMGAVLKNMGFSERYTVERGYEWMIHDAEMHDYILKNCGTRSGNKHIPREFMGLPLSKLRVLFDALMLGDGSVDSRPGRTSMYYSSTSKQLADDVQEIAFKLGYRAKIHIQIDPRPSRAVLYRVEMCRNGMEYADCRQDDITTEFYDGIVWCFEVSTHLFVTRRNGKIAIQGNTAKVRMEFFYDNVAAMQKRLANSYNRQLIDKFTGSPGLAKIIFNDANTEDDNSLFDRAAKIMSATPMDPYSTISRDEIRESLGFEPDEEPELEELPDE